jgi:hypothetical protein
MAEIPSSRKYSSGGARHAPPPTIRSTPAPAASTVQVATPPRTATLSPKKQSSSMPWLFVLIGLALLAWWYVSNKDDLPYKPFPSRQVVWVVPSTYVNVRTGPGVEFPVFAKVAPSTSLWGLGEASDSNGDVWIAIETAEGGTAYVKGRLLIFRN